MKTRKRNVKWFEHFASRATQATGSNYAFIMACVVIFTWIAAGPFFHYSNAWQMVINTFTTTITFLMIFLIQKTQNKDAIAIQIKLNELIAANATASNHIVSIEDLSEDELRRLNEYYSRLAELTKKENKLKTSSSVESPENIKDQKRRHERRIVGIIK